jgi:hypothetical protein
MGRTNSCPDARLRRPGTGPAGNPELSGCRVTARVPHWHPCV